MHEIITGPVHCAVLVATFTLTMLTHIIFSVVATSS